MLPLIEPVIKPLEETSEKSWGYSFSVTHRNGGNYNVYSDLLYSVRAVRNGGNFLLEEQDRYGGGGFIQFGISPKMDSADKGLIKKIRGKAKEILKGAVSETREIDVGLQNIS